MFKDHEVYFQNTMLPVLVYGTHASGIRVQLRNTTYLSPVSRQQQQISREISSNPILDLQFTIACFQLPAVRVWARKQLPNVYKDWKVINNWSLTLRGFTFNYHQVCELLQTQGGTT